MPVWFEGAKEEVPVGTSVDRCKTGQRKSRCEL